MGELSPVVEGHLRIRDGKKWKNRFARVTRLSPVADFLTLQLWRDGKEVEKHESPTKGSISLSGYLGAETCFNLDKESNTMALIFQDNVIIIALQSREILIKWQVRLTGQFEEGQQYTVHLVSAPKKGKLVTGGQMKLHLQNNRFSLTTGIPPHLIHTWNMIDLRRYGGVDGGRFCIEGGTRCGKGEGLHVFRVDNSDEVQVAFDLASKGKLENRRQRLNPQTSLSLSQSPSVSSNLSTVHRSGDSGESGSSGSPLLHFGSVRSKEEIQRNRSRSRSRSMNTSGAWSSLDNGLALSSPDTLSLTLSDMDTEARISSPDHLVSRKTILERIGGLQEISGHSRHHNSSRSCGSESDFYLNWSVERGQPRRQGSVPWSGSSGSQYNGAGTGSGIWNPGTGNGTWNGRNWNGTLDRMSMSSGESQSSGSNYDQPKTVLKVTTSPQVLKRLPSSRGFSRPLSPSLSSASSLSPPLTPKSLRRVLQQQGGEGDHLRRQIAAAPCSCGTAAPREVPGFENYDIPRNLGNQDALQFYDTPRNIKEALGSSQQSQKDGMGNYDIPGDPLPVFTKPCGCLMRLTTSNTGEVRLVTSTPAEVMLMTQGEGEGRRSNNSTLDRDMTWTCAREGSTGECSELKIPRVKLTGQGRMPVVDMSKINAIRCLSEPPSEKDQATAAGRSLSPSIISGLPPRHSGGPVYAQIDRSKKQCQGCNQKIQHRCNKQVGRGAPPPPDHANYTNMDFAQSLSLYENSRDVLSRLEKLPQSSTRDQVETENYLPMYSSSNPDYELMRAPENPENAEYHEMALMSAGDRSSLCSADRSSLYSSNYDIVDSMALMSDTRFDTIKHAPKNFIKIDDETFMYKPEKEISLPDNAGTGISLQEQSLDQLSISLQGTNLFSGYVTIPRSKVSDSIHNLSKSQSPVLTMRRSASVPCKRDSTSSGGSDSGVSTGSPRQSTLDQLDSLDQTSGGSSPQSEMQTEVN